MMKSAFQAVKELMEIPAHWLVREGPSFWSSPLPWGLFAVATLLLGWFVHPFFYLPAIYVVSALLLKWNGNRIYWGWRRKLVSSSCPACAAVIGLAAADAAFANRSREYREYIAGVPRGGFISFNGVEEVLFCCPGCDTHLGFACCGPGEIYVDEDWDQRDHEPIAEGHPGRPCE